MDVHLDHATSARGWLYGLRSRIISAWSRRSDTRARRTASASRIRASAAARPSCTASSRSHSRHVTRSQLPVPRCALEFRERHVLRPRRLRRFRPRRRRTCRRKRSCGRSKRWWRRACRTNASRSSRVGGACPSAALYATAHPESVERLICLDPVHPSCGSRTVVRTDWSMGRRMIASAVFPDGPVERQRWWSRAVRDSISQAAWIAASEAYEEIDQLSVFERCVCRRCSSCRRRERRIVNTLCVSRRPSMTHAWC